ncbi:MAG: hypothetical protein OXI95_12590 [bacterium]|nr:hypothetical protein [bacterium]
MTRRPKRPGKYSLSCTDEAWERIGARASRDDMPVSAYLVRAALAVDPTRAKVDVARAMEQQQTIAEAARLLIAHLPPVPPETATSFWTTLHGRISFLVRMAMDDMLEKGARGDLERHLDRQFGAGQGANMVAAYLERTRRDDIPE